MAQTADKLADGGKAHQVRSMFSEIAPTYDLLNHTLSLNIDNRWRRFTRRKLGDVLNRPGALALDLCCGTADLSLELAGAAPTFGVDFCRPMLQRGQEKIKAVNSPVFLIEGDALHTPFGDNSFDVVTIGFGLRNLENLSDGLSEIYRLLRPRGRAGVLEFSHPRTPVFRQLFNFYFMKLLPMVGNTISGSRFAYRYLPESVKEFPSRESLAAMMRAVGFSNVEYYNLLFGAVSLHVGDKD